MQCDTPYHSSGARCNLKFGTFASLVESATGVRGHNRDTTAITKTAVSETILIALLSLPGFDFFLFWRRKIKRRSHAPLRLCNWDVISTHVAATHEPIVIELPMFITMRSEPLPRVGIAPFVLKTYRDPIGCVCP